MDNKVYITFDEIIAGLKTIAGRLEKENFDQIVVVTRGGLCVAGLLSQLLSVRTIDTISIVSYKGMKRHKTDVLKLPRHRKIKTLIVDDVVDSGETLDYVHQLFTNAKSFTLHYKPGSSNYQPDYYLWESDKWIVYPWEFNEQ